ncbi:hypothetical protein PV327_004297 [Microctonus hyperodae]|uniref:phospholipase A1 n=1 Tax=Microctonus hyperodae TaxID=165561 RepID=A0AA39FC31_MICHY|nr:hypothetical protein PV327_004297 [Microctonus hyperodae]
MNGFSRLNIFIFILYSIGSTQSNGHYLDKFLERRNRVIQRRDELISKVCFDHLGCFIDPPKRLTLNRPPEHPNIIQTKFLLYTRKNREPEILHYDDESKSIERSNFNGSKRLKILAHGFKGSGSNAGVITATNLLLDLDDVNVIVIDWTRGAGTTYQAAVANTELVGRQLALIILDAIKLGTKPDDIHIAGFSLGAHVAGCASEVLKKKKLLLGRITGLDPASPLFRHHILRERSRKLDVSDARLVDVIHTDGSEIFTDGFGLLKPIGHIDFFPNGGRQQPGCKDIKNSIIYSHLHEDELDRSIACSHLRAWQLYVATLQSQFEECKFIGWICPRRADTFVYGNCFPLENSRELNQEMGFGVDGGLLGSYYLPTRSESPFCGDPFRASVNVARDSPITLGILFLKIKHGNTSTIFEINCNLNERIERQLTFFAIAATTFKAINKNITIINGLIWYQKIIEDNQEEVSTRRPRSSTLLVDGLAIEDRKGNRWEYCKEKLLIGVEAKPVDFQRENNVHLM